MRSSRSSSTSNFAYSFGPGPLTPGIRMLIIANVAAFVAMFIAKDMMLLWLGLSPAAVLTQGWVWQPVTYMFLHSGIGHILFNMLALWMFGVEMERMWGTRYFLKYYFITGVGAAVTTLILAFVPPFAQSLYPSLTVGASGAIYGVLLAYALYFPNRPIYMYFIFPIPAKYFVMIIGAVSFFSALGSGGGVAHTAHLGGLVVGYLYLKSGRIHPLSEIKYRWVKWRINRMRRKFDVHTGGRADNVNRRVH
jgi:membrane associated rhomboid family serine protease